MGGSNGNKKWDKKIERIARGELDDIVQKTPFTMQKIQLMGPEEVDRSGGLK